MHHFRTNLKRDGFIEVWSDDALPTYVSDVLSHVCSTERYRRQKYSVPTASWERISCWILSSGWTVD